MSSNKYCIPHLLHLCTHFGGLEHLEHHVIKTPLEPEITFSDDPLRIMRAIRFASQLQFKIQPQTWRAIKAVAPRIEIISKEISKSFMIYFNEFWKQSKKFKT